MKIPTCCHAHPNAVNRPFRRAADRTCPCRGECGHHPGPVDQDAVDLFRWLLHVRTAKPGGLVMVLRNQDRAEYTIDTLRDLAERWGLPTRRRAQVLHLADRQVAVITATRIGQWLRGVDVVGAFLGEDLPPAEYADSLLILATRLRAAGVQVFPERHAPMLTEHAWLLGAVAAFGQCTCGPNWCYFDGLNEPCKLCADLKPSERCPGQRPEIYPAWVLAALNPAGDR